MQVYLLSFTILKILIKPTIIPKNKNKRVNFGVRFNFLSKKTPNKIPPTIGTATENPTSVPTGEFKFFRLSESTF